jgi:hypothetical protein
MITVITKEEAACMYKKEEFNEARAQEIIKEIEDQGLVLCYTINRSNTPVAVGPQSFKRRWPCYKLYPAYIEEGVLEDA